MLYTYVPTRIYPPIPPWWVERGRLLWERVAIREGYEFGENWRNEGWKERGWRYIDVSRGGRILLLGKRPRLTHGRFGECVRGQLGQGFVDEGDQRARGEVINVRQCPLFFALSLSLLLSHFNRRTALLLSQFETHWFSFSYEFGVPPLLLVPPFTLLPPSPLLFPPSTLLSPFTQSRSLRLAAIVRRRHFRSIKFN